MGFWVRNGIFGILLVGLAYWFLANQDFLLSLAGDNEAKVVDSNTSKPVKTEPKKAEQAKTSTEKSAATKGKYSARVKSSNAAADGLSRFYANLYGEKSGPKIRNNVVFLPDPKGDLVKILQARKMVVRPYRKNWLGSTDSRPFRKGETLNQKLTEYAQKDGLEVIWWLNKDFIVKDAFRIEKNILKTSYQVGQAVAGHFPEGISVYFCYRQRAMVLISEPMDYLNDECTLLGANKRY